MMRFSRLNKWKNIQSRIVSLDELCIVFEIESIRRDVAVGIRGTIERYTEA